jgi:hypothetical protein
MPLGDYGKVIAALNASGRHGQAACHQCRDPVEGGIAELLPAQACL